MLIIFCFVLLSNSQEYNYSNQGNDWYLKYPICNADSQSPINLSTEYATSCDTRGLSIYWNTSMLAKVTSNMQRETTGNFGSAILKVDKNYYKYEAKSMEIHVPSEHRINGINYDAEIQFVFSASGKVDGVFQKFIFAVLFSADSNSENKFISQWNQLNLNQEKELDLQYWYDLQQKVFNKYNYYDGSLNRPDCSETVKWVVSRDILPMSKTQKDLLLGFFGGIGNNRAV